MEMPDADTLWLDEDYVAHLTDGSFGLRQDYHHPRVVEALRRENEEQARILGMSAEIELSLRAKLDLMERENEKLKAKLDKAKWQPIETAPKDGTELLVYCPPKCTGKPTKIRIRKAAFKNGIYWHDGAVNYPVQPTHWMPLPDAPEQR